MRRLFWLLVGAVLGVLGLRKVQQTTTRVTTATRLTHPQLSATVGVAVAGAGEAIRRIGVRIQADAVDAADRERSQPPSDTALDVPPGAPNGHHPVSAS